MNPRRDEEFTQYVSAHLASFRRLAYLLCQDWHRADDLVQAAITRLYVQWGRASAVDHTDAYARTILVREFLREQRSGWARRVSLDAATADRPAFAPDRDAALDVRTAPNGLADTAQVLASAPGGQGVGTNTLSASLTLDIPVATPADAYSGLLTITYLEAGPIQVVVTFLPHGVPRVARDKSAWRSVSFANRSPVVPAALACCPYGRRSWR